MFVCNNYRILNDSLSIYLHISCIQICEYNSLSCQQQLLMYESLFSSVNRILPTWAYLGLFNSERGGGGRKMATKNNDLFINRCLYPYPALFPHFINVWWGQDNILGGGA